ncbi:pyridoxine/pyridoxamine 5'-phosphate oxidase [Streptomyces sp. NBRC 110611]|uniref:pyridoxamine 5'-phosphate oxidase n=1 Tax=Streptomyces sp. NBRC 110611 TaxID=1621259 RepID=UPI000856149D|nr:pyridoxamine 5'-phosphate oxidase [Streptomyces sp. NBRC 110611]GAU69864.1 pyridoxine/pyridoxamine 5'-phosphate oxidase [Streptomyces sp. NBRC 110611]
MSIPRDGLPEHAAGTADEDAPFTLFGQWLAEASASELNDPNAMAIATTGADGLPDVRMVLLKHHDSRGFVFFTNTASAKGRELAENMQASGVLHWKSLRRQVRFRGPAEFVTPDESDAYFASRARDSRIGAWASRQSGPLAARKLLEDAVAAQAKRFEGREVPRPEHWTGYRVRPVYLEFWSDRPFRLHDRVVFTRMSPQGPWEQGRLYP